MSVKSDNAEIAVLQTQMEDVKGQIRSVSETVSRIEAKMDNRDEVYVLRTDFAQFKKQYWLSHTLTALLTAIIIGTIEYVVLGVLIKK
ncbi:MAG: hypothetical protein KGI25_03590 [Thaumarchaeota archaeon]|nr:hypothetical protein [Nitrososphaerota archaeon]